MQTQTLPSLLVVEDDAILRERVLLPGLGDYGFAVQGIESIRELYQQAATALADIVILDVGLPDGDGFSAARWLRQQFPAAGIVLLTGRGGTPDRVRGLTEGADAYLAKPLDLDLLVATLHSLARRLSQQASAAGASVQGTWHLDLQGWSLVSPGDRRVALTRNERKVLMRLTTAHKVVGREQLIAALTDNVHDFDPHRLDSLIHRLRRKVQDTAGEPLPLTSVHGEGYLFAR